MKKLYFLLIFLCIFNHSFSTQILIPMDETTQKNHLKAYGIAYLVLKKGFELNWLLNYKGGSFMFPYNEELEKIATIRGVSLEIISEIEANTIVDEILAPEVNKDVVKLEKLPKVAVYSPKNKQPWDDAVTLVLQYAEIEYDVIYDDEIMKDALLKYDWLHLHHEDFTGQFGKFYASYSQTEWYQEQVRDLTNKANQYGFNKVSKFKLQISKNIQDFVLGGGFLFAMCSATDTYDISLASQNTDICESMFDGDPADPQAQSKLDFTQTFAFQNFTLEKNPYEYEHSNIDVSSTRVVDPQLDFFTLFEFSAKWDQIPTILTQNHVKVVKGFMGQTTAFNKDLIKPEILILGENKKYNEARYVHGEYGKGTWCFYGGHDPEDYQHFVGDPPTDLSLHPNSPGYRLILNNILFPAAKKKKRKT